MQVLVVHLVPAPHVRGLAAGVRNGRRVFRRTGGRRFRRRLVVGVFVDGQRAAAEDVHHPVEAASRDFRPPRFSKSVRTFCWQSPRRFESRHSHPLICFLGARFGEFSIRTYGHSGLREKSCRRSPYDVNSFLVALSVSSRHKATVLNGT